MALAWCVLICLMALGFVGTQGNQEAGTADARADAAAANAAIGALN